MPASVCYVISAMSNSAAAAAASARPLLLSAVSSHATLVIGTTGVPSAFFVTVSAADPDSRVLLGPYNLLASNPRLSCLTLSCSRDSQGQTRRSLAQLALLCICVLLQRHAHACVLACCS